MMRLLLPLLLLAFSQLLFSQSITCPPDATIQCYESFTQDPILEDAAGLELSTALEFVGDGCDTFNIRVKYALSDTIEVASCFTTLTVVPFSESIVFPRDTTLYNYRLSDVYRQPLFTEQMFPNVIGECNIAFTFDDLVVESYPTLNVFRDWKATNQCTGQEVMGVQHIKLNDIPNGSIRTQVSDCRGNKLKVDSVSVFINGDIIDYDACVQPYDSLFQIINCIAEESNLTDQDVLEIELHDILNQLAHISTYDLLIIQRHIIGFERFTTECQRNAADINRDGRINGIDLVELRKLILGIYTEWPTAYGYHPEFTVNGEVMEALRFTADDFPLEDLQISLSKQGDVDRN